MRNPAKTIFKIHEDHMEHLASDIASGHECSDLESRIDAFHDGAFEVFQPVSRGHRSGMDALLLAACLPLGASGKIVDLGCGAGVAGFAALNLHEGLELLAVEKDNSMVALAKKSVSLPVNAGLSNRVNILNADVTLTGQRRQDAGLSENDFDFVIMNPPYNSGRHRRPNEIMKAEAHIMGEGGTDAWFRTASAILRSGGKLCMIHRTEDLPLLLACTQGRFGNLEIMPVHSKAQEPAKRILVRATRGSRAGMKLMPGFVVHEADGHFTDLAEDIFRGRNILSFD